VLAATRRERWLAHTLVGLAEVAVLRGELERADALFRQAHERFSLVEDEARVAAVAERLAALR
jgi:hypothetical protein